MYVPDEGFEFAEFDLNRGESWIYAHLSEDPELLRIHLEGLDFHAETASAISGEFDSEPRAVDWIIEHKKDTAFRLRYLGKRVNHASSYRMRAFKGAEVVNKEADETGVTVTSSEYNKAHEIWLAKYWAVPGKWWPEIEDQLGKDRTMRTPYGRQLEFHDRWGDKLFRDATAYVPQSTSVDYINRGFLRVFHEFVRTGAWGLSVLAQTHDSILCQYRTQDRDEAVPAIAHALGDRELTIKGRTFRIPIEASIGDSWGGLKAYAL
jgi:DNA polymerase I-like protein with 3'-5' exonuclease and polymerase domains